MLLYNDGVPFEVSFFNSPIFPKVATNYLGLFLKDSWTVGRRLTLNVGLRYADDDGSVPDECREAAAPPSEVTFPAQCFPMCSSDLEYRGPAHSRGATISPAMARP